MIIFRKLVLCITSIAFFSASSFSAHQRDRALPQPTTCITSSFSAVGGNDYKTITLTLLNQCGKTIDFQNAVITFQSRTSLQTNFWGNFSPLSYPDNNLQITSQGSAGSFLASLTLHFPTASWANSKLPANQSFQIIYGTPVDGHVGNANVYVGGSEAEPGQLAIKVQTLPIELAGYTGKPIAQVTRTDTQATVQANLNWGETTTITQLISGIRYSFSTASIRYNNYNCEPSFYPSTIIAASTTVPLTTLSYSCTQSVGTPVSQNGQLRVCGTQLCNQQGQAIQLKGMSSHGIQWYGWQGSNTGKACLTASSLDTLANNWKASALRVSLYVQEGGYETDPQGFTNQVSALINEATRRGIYVIVDWHILNPGDPNFNLARAKTFFTAIANTHKDNNNILYEIANEPNGVPWSSIKTYAESLIPVIRAIDSDAVILVGTPGWSSLGISDGRSAQDIINSPLNFSNIMYTFHFYAASHRDNYLNEVDRASNFIPIFVTEFGSQDYSGGGANDFQMTNRYLELFARKKISWTNWNYSDDALSGAIWKNGTCSNGPWTDANLKESGSYIKAKILN